MWLKNNPLQEECLSAFGYFKALAVPELYAAAMDVLVNEVFIDEVGAVDTQKIMTIQFSFKPFEHLGHYQCCIVAEEKLAVITDGLDTDNGGGINDGYSRIVR